MSKQFSVGQSVEVFKLKPLPQQKIAYSLKAQGVITRVGKTTVTVKYLNNEKKFGRKTGIAVGQSQLWQPIKIRLK